MMSRFCLCALMLALAAGPALAAPDGPAAPGMPAPGGATPGVAAPDLVAGAKSVFLPYLNAPLAGSPLRHSPKLGLSVNGGRPIRAVMDTGSLGIVVSARLIPEFDTLEVLKPGELTYTSSGRIMKGVWVKARVTLSGTNGAEVTTRPIPVLAVTHVECTRTARRCRPRANPTGIAMIGVGFARGGEVEKLGLADRNAFLSLPGMGTADAPATVRRGYLVTRRGVYLGLSAEGAKGMDFIKLEKAQGRSGWAPTPVCLSLGGRTPAACGTALVDTGVTTMYLTLPPAQLTGQTQPNPAGVPTPTSGTALRIAFGPGGSGPSYAFRAGDQTNPSAPHAIILVNRPGTVFVNTSVRLLNRFDYLYDADGGFVGFRPVASP